MELRNDRRRNADRQPNPQTCRHRGIDRNCRTSRAVRTRCLAGRGRDRPARLPLAGADDRAVGTGQTNRTDNQQAAVQKRRRGDRRHVVLRRRNPQRRTANRQAITRRDNHCASNTRRDGAANGQFIDFAGARLVRRDGHQGRRDQDSLGRCRDGRVSRGDRFDQCVSEILPAQINLPLRRCGVRQAGHRDRLTG